MLKVYGSPLCPDCRNCTLSLDRGRIEYEYMDITSSIPTLKAFLSLRDTDPAFDGPKAAGSIGIPALVPEDGTVLTDWEAYLKERGIPVLYETEGASCGLDRKSC